MKKIIIMLTAILCLSVFVGCDNPDKDLAENKSGANTTSSDSQTVSEIKDNQSLVKCENGTYTITLPESNIVLEVPHYYEKYIPSVKDELIAEAEAKIADAVANYPENSGYYLTSDYEGHLCLCIEVIRDIDPPNIVVDGDVTMSRGCDIDHEHIFFAEIITE